MTPLLIALAREPRPLWRFLLGEFTGIIYWFGICYWIQFVLEVHGGMGRWGGWGTFLLFCLAKAIHLGVFSLLAAVVMRTWYAVPAIAALWTGIERTHGTFGFAWLALGNSAIDMRAADEAGAVCRSLWNFLRAGDHGGDSSGHHSAPWTPRTGVAGGGSSAVALA